MLQPKKRNYPKAQKGKVSFLPAVRGIQCAPGINSNFSNFGLIALEPGRINNKQIEAARVAINRKIKRYGKLRFKIFPDIPVTKKPLEMRMGQGKGPILT
jgi:large subunit ribosomal protein L16